MKVNTILSKNLLHVFKKRLVNAQELNNYFKSHPDTKKRIGTLPVDFFENIPNAQRGVLTQRVGDVFESFSKQINSFENVFNGKDYEKSVLITNEMVNSLKTLLNRNDISGNYIESGSFKNCYKLQVGKFSYALSIFKQYPPYNPREYFRESHGKGNEPQNIFTVYKRFFHGRICKPFLAKLSTENEDGGFMLSKFIEKTHSSKADLGIFQKKELICIITMS